MRTGSGKSAATNANSAARSPGSGVDMGHVTKTPAGRYRANWRDPVFGRSLWNTFLVTAVTMLLTVVLANILALVLKADLRGKWGVRFLVLLPWTTPAALGAIAWVFMLDSLLSPIDWILWQLGLLEDGRP